MVLEVQFVVRRSNAVHRLLWDLHSWLELIPSNQLSALGFKAAVTSLSLSNSVTSSFHPFARGPKPAGNSSDVLDPFILLIFLPAVSFYTLVAKLAHPCQWSSEGSHSIECSAGVYTQEPGLESSFYLLCSYGLLRGRELKNPGYPLQRWRLACDQLILSSAGSHRGENFKGGNSFGRSNGCCLLSIHYLPGITHI